MPFPARQVSSDAYDTLTGALSRDGLEACIDSAVETVPGTLAVLFADLHRFRLVNDAFGHQVGDEVLRVVAQRLQATLRGGDHLARFGGDSFVMVCPGVEGEREAVAIADRIAAVMTQPVGTSAGTIPVDARVGIALTSGRTDTAQDLLHDADTALHWVKERPGTTYAIFEPVMRGGVVQQLTLDRELRRAIVNDELRLHYQPILDVATGRISSFEALVRWEHPVRGLVGPDEFIAQAERMGYISDLGRWALRGACRQIAVWTASEPGCEWARVAVNVSGVQLSDPAFPGEVERAITEAGIDPFRLSIEITESALIEASANAEGTLSELKRLGLQVVLDDFGTGYSSLGYLARFPVDSIKLDRNFISGAESARSRPIVEAVAGMARSLGLDLVGEGVETDEQLDMLSTVGFDLAQGFHFARPMPASQVEGWVSRRGAPGNGHWPRHPTADAGTLTLGEAAQTLGVSVSTVRRWADSGRLSSQRTKGGHRRFALEDVRRLAAVGTPRPRLRSDPPFSAAVPRFGALLRGQGEHLTDAALRALYEPRGQGWLAGERGRAAVSAWVTGVGYAALRGEPQGALQATRSFARRAEAAGVSLVELVLFVERFSAAATVAARSGLDHQQRVQVQRLLGAQRRAVLAEA